MKVKANESPDIRKLRAKLKHQIGTQNKKINPKALHKMSKMIKHWISRHEGERITLKSKDIKIFDENVHPAQIKSKYIRHLLKDLSTPIKPESGSSLQGRVSG